MINGLGDGRAPSKHHSALGHYVVTERRQLRIRNSVIMQQLAHLMKLLKHTFFFILLGVR